MSPRILARLAGVALVDVVRTYLELTSESQLLPCEPPDPRARVERVSGRRPPSSATCIRRSDATTAGSIGWPGRTTQLRQRLAQPGVSLHLLTLAAAPAGYFELERHADDSAEIAYLGLLPEFRGRGLGGFLLSEAVREAWATGASRVWLHTCTLDSPAALPNYLARGFRPFKEERYVAETPPRRRARAEKKRVRSRRQTAILKKSLAPPIPELKYPPSSPLSVVLFSVNSVIS